MRIARTNHYRYEKWEALEMLARTPDQVKLLEEDILGGVDPGQ